jgi:hypothetical protein
MKQVALFHPFFLATLTLGAAGLCASAAATATAPAPFSDYQPILDRMPFGALPVGFGQAPAVVPTQTDAQVQAEQQKLAKQINMSCINVTPEGTTAIGFTDLEAKPPVNYYLLVGTSAGGWTVVDADYDLEVAVIEKAGVTINLKLGKGLIDDATLKDLIKPPAAAAQRAGAQPAAVAAQDPASALQRPAPLPRPSTGERTLLNIPGLVRHSSAEAEQSREDLELAKIKKDGGDVGSYMERQQERKRQADEQKAAAEQATRGKLQELARKITQDELAKQERARNLSLIERGEKPISAIELTPEEEAALVAKGVLAQ